MAGNGLRVSFRLLGLAVVIEIIRAVPLPRHVWPPGVVPAFEFGTRERQVVESLDDWHALEPFASERLDNAFLGQNRGCTLPTVGRSLGRLARLLTTQRRWSKGLVVPWSLAGVTRKELSIRSSLSPVSCNTRDEPRLASARWHSKLPERELSCPATPAQRFGSYAF